MIGGEESFGKFKSSSNKKSIILAVAVILVLFGLFWIAGTTGLFSLIMPKPELTVDVYATSSWGIMRGCTASASFTVRNIGKVDAKDVYVELVLYANDGPRDSRSFNLGTIQKDSSRSNSASNLDYECGDSVKIVVNARSKEGVTASAQAYL